MGKSLLHPVKGMMWHQRWRQLRSKGARLFKFLLIILTMGFCLGCSQTQTPPSTSFELIVGRIGSDRPIYCVKAPIAWQRVDVKDTTLLKDTTQALCTFLINDGDNPIRITIHDFPFTDELERIPPSAQINRWQQQLGNDLIDSFAVLSNSQAGYVGLRFEGFGNSKAMIAWSMQLAPEYLSEPKRTLADYTIKAVGSSEEMELHRDAIIAFAHSFRPLNPTSSLHHD